MSDLLNLSFVLHDGAGSVAWCIRVQVLDQLERKSRRDGIHPTKLFVFCLPADSSSNGTTISIQKRQVCHYVSIHNRAADDEICSIEPQISVRRHPNNDQSCRTLLVASTNKRIEGWPERIELGSEIVRGRARDGLWIDLRASAA